MAKKEPDVPFSRSGCEGSQERTFRGTFPEAAIQDNQQTAHVVDEEQLSLRSRTDTWIPDRDEWGHQRRWCRRRRRAS